MAAAESSAADVDGVLDSFGFGAVTELPLKIAALESAVARLDDIVVRLAASTAEIREYLLADPKDDDLLQAVEENEAILGRKREAVRLVRAAIAKLEKEQAAAAAASAAAKASLAEAERAELGTAAEESGGASWPKVPPSFDREAAEPSPYQRQVDARARAEGAAVAPEAGGAAGADTDGAPAGAGPASDDGGVFL